MQDLQFSPNTIVQNLRELADKLEGGEATLQAGKFNVGDGFGVNVQPGWSVVVNVPGGPVPLEGGEIIQQVVPGHDIEITVQPSKRGMMNMLAGEGIAGAVPMEGPMG